MDNLGAIVGQLLALGLVAAVGVRTAILLSVIPGLLAAAAIVFAIRKARLPKTQERRPLRFRVRPVLRGRLGRVLLGFTAFEVGNVAATLLILRATDLLTDTHGLDTATQIGIGLYVAYNLAATATSFPAGGLSDRLGGRGPLLVTAAGVTAFLLAYLLFAITGPPSCARWSAVPASTPSASSGPAPTTDSPPSPGSPASTAANDHRRPAATRSPDDRLTGPGPGRHHRPAGPGAGPAPGAAAQFPPRLPRRPAAIAARQRARLAAQADYARTRSPLYRQLYAGLPERVEDPRLLPVTGKAALMDRFDDGVTDPAVTLQRVREFVADPALIGRSFHGAHAGYTAGHHLRHHRHFSGPCSEASTLMMSRWPQCGAAEDPSEAGTHARVPGRWTRRRDRCTR
jgi:hypothetical protein